MLRQLPIMPKFVLHLLRSSPKGRGPAEPGLVLMWTLGCHEIKLDSPGLGSVATPRTVTVVTDITSSLRTISLLNSTVWRPILAENERHHDLDGYDRIRCAIQELS